MDDMYLFKSQDEGNRMLYAYYKGEFWFFDPNVQQWYISGHVREQYELEAQKVDGLTPDDFTCTGYGYEFVAEYEVTVAVLDALRAAKKVLPPEPASVEPPEIVDEGSGAEEDCLPQNPTDAAPASRADAGAAEQSPSVAGPASLEAPLSDSSAFDYSGLPTDTAEHLQNLARRAAQAKQRYILDMMEIVVEAHSELVAPCDKHNNQHSEATFRAWCASIGVGKDTAYRLLQVQALMDGSTPEEQEVLADAPAKLLYAAAKPSAPAELVQAVKDGDITTHKQYQDLLARYNAERAAREKAEQERDEAATHIQAARDMQIDTARERDTALRRAAEAEKQRDGAREALAASKLRGDKLKAENDALKAHPIEAQVVDEEEIDRRAQARADELTAPLREELEALRSRHPADPEEAEQAIRDAYDSAVYTGRVIESAWRSLCPLLPRMDADRRELALNQIVKIVSTIQGECIKCL